LSFPHVSERAFSSISRLKGQNLWRGNRVRVLGAIPGAADLEVRGTMPYSVQIRSDETKRNLSVHCTCPYFADGHACKHIWAALLAISKKGVFGSAPGKEFQVTLSAKSPAVRRNRGPADVVSWRDEIARAQAPRPASFDNINYGRVESNKVIGFVVDLPYCLRQQKIRLRFVIQEYLKNGTLGVMKFAELNQDSMRFFPDPVDRQLLRAVLGRTEINASSSFFAPSRGIPSVGVPADYAEDLLAEISTAGRLLLQKREAHSFSKNVKLEPLPYLFNPEKWRLRALLERTGPVFALSARLESDSQSANLKDLLGTVDRFVFFESFMATSDTDKTGAWLSLFQKNRRLEIPENEIDHFLEMYLNDPMTPTLDLPAELGFTEIPSAAPVVRLVFSNLDDSPLFEARLSFKYGERVVQSQEVTSFIYDIPRKQKLVRNMSFENEAKASFATLGALPADRSREAGQDVDGIFQEPSFVLAATKAIDLGWEVVVNQKRLSYGTNFDMKVTSSGVDWFDVNVQFDFQGAKISLPDLLFQIQEGEKFILLDDGTYGLLPTEWRARFGRMAGMGQTTPQGLRLNKIQALFLSADLQGNEKFKADKKFRSLQEIVTRLNDLRGIAAPTLFKGKLRKYQKEGLAWLRLIAEHEIGGILADDMGLGKTVQLLALIATQRSKASLPHLIVAPKSLIFNWLQESAKFTPHLRILNLTGAGRVRTTDEFSNYDVVITNYPTLRSDIERLRDVRFDTFILDEAHYAKNPKSQAAMACRLIKARSKFALTGTPVENSLNDLFSIMAIVNPGLLSDQHAQNWTREKDPEAFLRLARALKPFILRRTKDKVLKDLPAKSEQVIYCELGESERKRYDELRDYYWGQLSGKFEQKGLARSKIDVLEALLRLRQAACHQGMLDQKLAGNMSTKFELLLEQLGSVIQDGHKALVFSQFTSLLKLLKVQLDQHQITYEYLDGQTKDRQQRVEKFQQDHGTQVFLLSLKAGGVGLNLTAADYVFILDPWWNPAAEAQAIDRTHRIGQKNKVFAYKIIAKDTVEEKILALQESKKKLALTVLSNDASVFKNLSVEDLRELFS